MRIKEVIAITKILLIFQILSTNSLRKCMEYSLENLYVDNGAFSPHEKWCLDKSVGQTENGLERGFVKHELN